MKLLLVVFFFSSLDLSQVPITAGAPIIAAGPVEPESLSKEVGAFSQHIVFWRRFLWSKRGECGFV